MTREELNYIKDAFSQIIDDIAGNPDWGESARAVASDLGTLERKLEEKISSLPTNLDEAAEDCIQGLIPEAELPATTPFALEYVIEMLYKTFKAGAEWVAGQGESHETEIVSRVTGNGLLPAVSCLVNKSYKEGDKVVVQIRKR